MVSKKEIQELIKKQKNKGITLIALVITIIVLLILAAVSIATLTGDEGIVARAEDTRDKWNIESEKEAISLECLSYQKEKGEKEKLGIELYDKNLYNGEKWNMVFTDERNYGTDWNYIEKGTEVEEYGKTKYNWVINYNTGEIIYLEENKYHQLDYTESVAIRGDELVMNIDATNLSNESSWENIENHGGVAYDSENMALTFDGVDDYLELTKPGDFSNGFTFEIYMNLDRLRYDNGSGLFHGGLFCKMHSLSDTFSDALKFGFCYGGTIARFYKSSSWYGDGSYLRTSSIGEVIMPDINRIEPQCTQKDKYITIVYYRYGKSQLQNEEIASFMEKNKCDILAYYIDGVLYGYTGHGKDSYDEGLKIWGGDNVPMFIGVGPWEKTDNLYYIKGKVYTVRFYTKALDSGDVEKNHTQTLDYREALKKLE